MATRLFPSFRVSSLGKSHPQFEETFRPVVRQWWQQYHLKVVKKSPKKFLLDMQKPVGITPRNFFLKHQNFLLQNPKKTLFCKFLKKLFCQRYIADRYKTILTHLPTFFSQNRNRFCSKSRKVMFFFQYKAKIFFWRGRLQIQQQESKNFAFEFRIKC